jgi:ketosteroid isomerase-like protein
MKRFAFLLLALLFALPCASRQTASGPAIGNHDDELNEIASRWMAAYNGTDAKHLEPLYAEDAQYISGHVAGLVADGRDKVIANFQVGMQMGGHIDDLIVLSTQVSDTLATVLCEYHATNAGQKAVGRTLLLFRRQNNAWKIYLHMTVV